MHCLWCRDKVCGCVEPDEPDPIKYNTTFPQRWKTFTNKNGLKTVDVEGVKALLAKSDFLGVSAYASMAIPTGFNELERPVQVRAVPLPWHAF